MRRRTHQSQCFRFLGRLPTLTALGFSFLGAAAACDQGQEQKQRVIAPKGRSQAVLGPATAKASAVAPAVPKQPVAKRRLCESLAAGRPLPQEVISRAAAPGAALPPERIQIGAGWTWVNFWAAWCEPCKEEIPRLLSWDRQLRSRFDLVFITLDDDSRQLQAFLAGQKASGLRSSYWLKEGAERQDWLVAAGLSPDPQLPFHLLVDSRGRIRCVVDGAVEDADFDRVRQIVGG